MIPHSTRHSINFKWSNSQPKPARNSKAPNQAKNTNSDAALSIILLLLVLRNTTIAKYLLLPIIIGIYLQ
jgi:hypothetical protein